MSKADGKKIAIKFTMPLNPMTPIETPIAHKYFRWQIDTIWSTRVYLYGIELKTDSDFYLPSGIVTSSGYYSSFIHDRAFDGNIATYWRPSAYPCWIQIELSSPIVLTAFKWNTEASSFNPRIFKLLGSNDGINWDELYADESPSTNYWKEFAVSPLTTITNGNETAFKVTGQEFQYINGPVIEKEYAIDSIQEHPTEPQSLLITVDQFARFNNVEGQLKVSYNSALGTLVGVGGAVQSFDAYFTPLDLLREINPNDEELITGTISSAAVEYSLIQYLNAYHEHALNANIASVVVEYTDIRIENP